MNIENALVSKLRSAAEQMPVRHLSVDELVTRGGRSLRVRRLAAAGAVTVFAALGVAVADGVVSNEKGSDMGPANRGLSAGRKYYQDMRVQTLRFSELVARGDERASWNMLSHRAQLAIGGFESWKRDESRTAEAAVGWIYHSDAALYLTPSIIFDDPYVYTLTALAPTEDDGSGLLETLSLRVAGDRILIDSDFDDRVMVTPESPIFMPGCAGEGCENPVDYRPAISNGTRLAFSLEPAGQVKDVMFSLGGDSLIMNTDLERSDDGKVYATARLAHSDAPRETFLNVVIETRDGEVESFGYRVIYEDGS